MDLKRALIELNKSNNKKDILEILGISFKEDYFEQVYYKDKMGLMNKGNYFISDLDGTFFRGVLQKEAFTLFVKFVKKQNYLDLDIEEYHKFLVDVTFFHDLEKKAYNKEIEYFEYLNAGIYLLLRYKNLIDWKEYLNFIKYTFKTKEKINPFRYSFKKIKEVLVGGNNFIFISGAPDFIFDIYLKGLKKYVSKNIGKELSNNIFGFGSHVSMNKPEYSPMWGSIHKEQFIGLLKSENIIDKVIGGMGDTSSDFGISYVCDKGNDFYFVNPEKKVLEKFDELKKEGINYHLIIERKDLVFEIDKDNIKYL